MASFLLRDCFFKSHLVVSRCVGTFGINDSGQVVGSSSTLVSEGHAIIWDGTTPTDLNSFMDKHDVDAGWVLEAAEDINDTG